MNEITEYPDGTSMSMTTRRGVIVAYHDGNEWVVSAPRQKQTHRVEGRDAAKAKMRELERELLGA